MIIEYRAKEGYWLWNHNDAIGNWMFTTVLSYADDKDEQMRRDWMEISDAEKIAKEEEQEEWRKRQEPEPPEEQAQEQTTEEQ